MKKGTNEGLKKESLVDAAKIKFSDIVTISAKDALADNGTPLSVCAFALMLLSADIYKVDNSALYGRRLEVRFSVSFFYLCSQKSMQRFTDFEESSDGIVQLDNTKHVL